MKYSAPYAKSMAFGVPFDTTSRDTVLVDELLAGKLTLPPHPTWNIPDELTWYENPFGEVNWQAQINMLRWLDPLRRAADQGNKQAADLWIRVVSSWIEKNPPGKGRSTYTWSDMVEAVRAMTMCFGLPMLEIHAPEAIDQVLKSIAEHGEWLANPKNIRRGNHALQQHQGLLVIGSVLERQDWLELATSRAVELLKSDYGHQGINAEGAPQYHQINFIKQWNR